ncbi:MAG: VWA domain-containing protein [Proteobacteria bacterium]|nr:VWA domain-containing protein [Pseudomonadota bacterium]
MQFAYPYALLALLLLPLCIYMYHRRQRCFCVFFPLQSRLTKHSPWYMRLLSHHSMLIFLLAITCLIIALARPRFGKNRSMQSSEGLDIFLVIDTSESMSSQDLTLLGKKVSRLEAVKAVVKNFIEKRVHDRLGLVIFGSRAFAQAPLTLDHPVLIDFLDEIYIGMAGSKTALGDAIGVSSNRLHRLDAPSKVMILLTDGANSAGSIDPQQAARAAKSLGIKIYTIAVAGEESSSLLGGVFDLIAPVAHVDEELLKQVAALTSGKYFRAKNTEDLQQIYATIDQLETKEVEESVFLMFEEHFFTYVLISLLLFFVLQIFSVLWTGRYLA